MKEELLKGLIFGQTFKQLIFHNLIPSLLHSLLQTDFHRIATMHLNGSGHRHCAT